MDDCIEWDGYRTKRGYGQAQLQPGEHPRGLRQTQAHRKVMADIHGWDALDGMVVMHSCDNPSCVNPAHLRVGTQKENVEDCILKRRFRPMLTKGHTMSRGERNGRARLNFQQVTEIRRRREDGGRADVLAKEYDVHRNTIYRAAVGDTWRFTT